MIHNQHPSIMEHGLDAGCQRCVEIAADPLIELDAENVRRLWTGKVKSRLDIEAYNVLYRVAVRASSMENKLQSTVRDFFKVGGKL